MAGKVKARTEQGYEHDTSGAHHRHAPPRLPRRKRTCRRGLVAGGALPFAEEMSGGLLPACIRYEARWHNHREVRLPPPKDLST